MHYSLQGKINLYLIYYYYILLQVCELSKIGGKSLQNMVYKIMKRVFEDCILIQYTYYGLRNKENFSLLAINRAIFGSTIL